ncbi:MAG: YcxB family protein [Chloroflexi bacterium]|nr:MAG: YcxB family protein [Chloroflexota bacterium]
MADTRVDFRYTSREVTSAQRIRFFRSQQFKITILLCLAAILYIAAPLVLPGVFPPTSYSSWGLVLYIVLAYLITMVVMLLVTPWVDFHINRMWKLPLTFTFNDKQLRLSVTGKTGGLHLKWNQIIKVDEGPLSFLLFYGGMNKFIILPKAALSDPVVEQRFRRVISQHTEKAEPTTRVEE